MVNMKKLNREDFINFYIIILYLVKLKKDDETDFSMFIISGLMLGSFQELVQSLV